VLALLLSLQAVVLPTPADVGVALAVSQACVDRDGFTLCNPEQAVGATFRQILCVEYGSDAEHRPIVRCVYKGARLEYSGGRIGTLPGRRTPSLRSYGDGAIDLIYVAGTWLPNNRD
jgi:hypothetical protein